MKKQVVIEGIQERPQDYDELKSIIEKIFRDEIYKPLLKMLGHGKLQNVKDPTTDVEAVMHAIRTGSLVFYRGEFTGRLGARITRGIKELGGKWDRKSGTFKLPSSKLTPDLKMAIVASEDRFKRSMAAVESFLLKAVPEQIASKFKIEKFFDSAIMRIDHRIDKSMKGLVVTPELTKEQRNKISEGYTNNLEKYIKDFTEKETLELREKMRKNYLKGQRYEGMVSTIQKSYGVSQRKAEFLARQETSLMMVEFKKVRYQDAGVNKYIWTCVSNNKDKSPQQNTPGNVRYFHAILDGKTFSWNNPPITDAKGSRNNPGGDFGCRCYARPVLEFDE